MLSATNGVRGLEGKEFDIDGCQPALNFACSHWLESHTVWMTNCWPDRQYVNNLDSSHKRTKTESTKNMVKESSRCDSLRLDNMWPS